MKVIKDTDYRDLREHLRRYGGFENNNKICYVCGKKIPEAKLDENRKMSFCSLRCGLVYWELLSKQIKEERFKKWARNTIKTKR